MKIISWNMAHRISAWHHLMESGADIALLQEACTPPRDVASRIEVDDAPWQTDGDGCVLPWRTAVVRLTDRVEVNWLRPCSIGQAKPGELPVSRRGTLAAAHVNSPSSDPLLVASIYASWERAHESTNSRWIYADASVHRLISDLSALIGQRQGHRILAAGDLNIFHGYGDKGSSYWAGRYATVFARMAAIGLPVAGPHHPNGRRAEPRPPEVPEDSPNVPTYFSTRSSPHAAGHQLDFVFASSSLAPQLRVLAVNGPEAWGPSDHCQLAIEFEERTAAV